MDITGKVFVVTGAGGGIGRCVATELVRRGATVVGGDRNEQGLDETGVQVAVPARFRARRLDISRRDDLPGFAEQVVADHGQVDGLFNIAGIAQEFETVAEVTDERIETLMRVNFFGTVWLTRAFLPYLLDRPRAAIMNTASSSAMVPVPGSAIYGASKAALEMFGYGLNQDLRGSGVTVTTAVPGSIWTDLVRKSALALGTSETLAKNFATMPEVAARRMIEATLHGRRRVVIGKDAHVYDAVGRVSRRAADRLSYLQVGRFVYRDRDAR
jgi:NAD(P)-dependent dehydrogenase (short-subunit alcohol dehydrogenase family)